MEVPIPHTMQHRVISHQNLRSQVLANRIFGFDAITETLNSFHISEIGMSEKVLNFATCPKMNGSVVLSRRLDGMGIGGLYTNYNMRRIR